MKNNAGFYPTDDKHLKEYCDILLPALSRIDFLGTSGAHMENYFYAKYCPQAEPLVYEGFEPLRGDWVSALYGKKVLVVSPFSSEIEFQYSRKDKLFAGHPEVCPDFELITLTAPLTCADAKPAVPSFFRSLAATTKNQNGNNDCHLQGGVGSFHAQLMAAEALVCFSFLG